MPNSFAVRPTAPKILSMMYYFLIDHTKKLIDHTELLIDHTKTLIDHTELLIDHTKKLIDINQRFGVRSNDNNREIKLVIHSV